MLKKEWIAYFEEINDRKPNIDEIHSAMESEEITMNFVDKILYNYRNKVPNKKVRKLIRISLILLTIFILFFPILKTNYNKMMYSTYSEKYEAVIEQYQNALSTKSDGEDYKLLIKQPSRQPSYAKIDSNGDSKEELYIAFKDGKNKYDILAVYEVKFGSVKKIEKSSLKISDELLSKANWRTFDVNNLVTMNLKELSEGNYKSIKGLWVTENKKEKLTFVDDGLALINDNNVRKEKSLTVKELMIYNWDISLSGRFLFREISKGSLVGTLEYKDGRDTLNGFIFIPKGIEYEGTDFNYDRIYDEMHKVVYYHASRDLEKQIAKTTKINMSEISKGNYSSLVGKWSSKSDSDKSGIKIDEEGTVYFDWAPSKGKKIVSVEIFPDAISLHLEGNSPNQFGPELLIVPAGVQFDGTKNDSSRDRISIGNKLELLNDPQVLYRVEQ